MVARPFFLKFTPSLLRISVRNFQFLAAFLVKKLIFPESESIFSIVVFGVVVVVVVAVLLFYTGRHAGKKYNYLLCGQQYYSEGKFFFSFFPNMAGKTYFVFFLSVAVFVDVFIVFVNELVTLVNSQSIASFVIKFTAVKLFTFFVTLVTVVIIPSS